MSRLESGKRRSRRQRRRRQQCMQLFAVVLGALCLSGLVMMAQMNELAPDGSHTYTTTDDIWYVPGEKVEVQAPVVEQASPTPRPTPQPTPAITAAVKMEETPEGAFRAVAPPTPEPSREPAAITITAVGDCTLGSYKTGSGKMSAFNAAFKRVGPEYFLQNMRQLFSEDDLTIVNLEGPLTKKTSKRPNRTFNFRGDLEHVQILTSASVEICNLANNHALDYKQAGFEDTYNLLMENGIGASGYGPEYFTEVKGYTVGSLGFTEWNFEPEHILERVQAAAQKCDLLIVSMHWGEERDPMLSRSNRKLGQAIIDAGADLIIGNHPHIYGEIERYNGKYIINTLGNFCFGGNDDPEIHDTAIFRQRFILQDGGEVQDGGIDIIPALISGTKEYNDFQPRIADEADGARMLKEIMGFSPTLSQDGVLWLENSYASRYGVQGNTAQQGAFAEETAVDEMPIAQDIAR